MKEKIEKKIHEFAECMYNLGFADGYEEKTRVSLEGCKECMYYAPGMVGTSNCLNGHSKAHAVSECFEERKLESI